MSLYAIKNDEGKYWNEVEERWTTTPCDGWEYKESAEEAASERHSHVVELIEKPAPVVVSEEEADMLEQAEYCAASVISAYSAEHIGAMGQDRLMRAYVNGWKVEKLKRYVLPMEGTKLADGTIAYATLDHTGVWTIKAYSKKQSAVAFHSTVTKADIDAAPEWVKSLVRIPVDTVK